jgi:hypothetical protein
MLGGLLATACGDEDDGDDDAADEAADDDASSATGGAGDDMAEAAEASVGDDAAEASAGDDAAEVTVGDDAAEAGSADAGSSGGASEAGTEAGGACEPDAADDECVTCTKSSCCGEIEACNADPICVCMQGCVMGLPDIAPCTKECGQNTTFGPLTQCAATNCAADCL